MTFTKYETAHAYHWSKLAGRGPRTYHARLHARYRWFVAQAQRRAPRRIVDVGCGDGALTHLLGVATGAETIGVEPNAAGIDEALRALTAVDSPARVVQGEAERLPFAGGAADVVVMCEVIEHVEDPAAVLREAARILTSDGTLLLSTPQTDGGPLPPFHLREYTAAELEAACEASFEDVTVSVAEPSWLIRAQAQRPLRVLTSTVAGLGLNPFAVTRAASVGTRTWRQLYAVARWPRHGDRGAI